MHRGIQTGNEDTERKADMFAGAFLMPSEAFGREFQAIAFSWEHVFRLKKRWGVSAAAIVKRAFDLSLMGAVAYEAASKHIYREGWNKAEPDDSRAQQSGLFENALSSLGQKETLTIDLPIEKLCEHFGFTPETFYEVTGIAIAPKNIPPSSGVETPSPVLITSPNVSEPAIAAARASETGSRQLPEPYGMDSVRPGTKDIFLLRGVDNCELARHCAQEDRAFGIEIWHREYGDLPAFKTAECFWVVINRSDDRAVNVRFLQSIADDSSLRERSRVAAVESVSSMSDLFASVLNMQSSHVFSGRLLESLYSFKPIPRPGDNKEIDALTEPPPPPESMPVSRNWWQC